MWVISVNLEPDNYLLIQAGEKKIDSCSFYWSLLSVERQAAPLQHLGSRGPAAAVAPFRFLDARASLFTI